MSLDIDIGQLSHGDIAPITERDGRPTKFATRLLAALNLLIGRTGGVQAFYLPLRSRTVAQLQALSPSVPAIGYCSNESGGETLVYWAPTAAVWRRTRDDATIS